MAMIIIVLGELEYLKGLMKMVHKHKYIVKQRKQVEGEFD
jgi:hypothetical protein